MSLLWTRRGALLSRRGIRRSSIRSLSCKDGGRFERRAKPTKCSFTIGRPSAPVPWRSTSEYPLSDTLWRELKRVETEAVHQSVSSSYRISALSRRPKRDGSALRRPCGLNECIKRPIAALASSLSRLHPEACWTGSMRSSAPPGRSKAVERLVERAPSEAAERACRTGRPGPASRAVPSCQSGRARGPAARPHRPSLRSWTKPETKRHSSDVCRVAPGQGDRDADEACKIPPAQR
jgi:hypothetical protein